MEQVASALPAWYRANDAVLAGMTSSALRNQAVTNAEQDALPEWVRALPVQAQQALTNPGLRLGMIEELSAPLALAEARATTYAVKESLDAEGFMTRFVIDAGMGFVEARKGHETILVEVKGTEIARDRAGLDDESCATSDVAFKEQMAHRGFQLTDLTMTEHRSVPGGELIRTAAQRNRRNLAEGAATARRSVSPAPSGARRLEAR